MARGNGTAAATVVARPRPNAMVAAAQVIPIGDRKAVKKAMGRRLEWQDEAWDYFDEVPEIKYSTWFLGNALSKLRIYAAVRNPDDPEGIPIPVTDPGLALPAGLAARAQAEVERLKSPLGGQSEILRELNMNLEIAAECYLVGIGPHEDPNAPADEPAIIPEAWDVKSVSEVEVKESGDTIIRDRPGGSNQGQKLDPANDTIIRIWQRHPRWSMLSDCAMRGVLSDCEALLLLTNQVKAEAKSHQSAGILAVPNELSFGPFRSRRAPNDATEPEDGEEATTDPFSDALMSALSEPIEDPSSAAAVMPLVVRGPGEMMTPEKFRHISLARDTSAVLEARIQARIERIARGLNLPVEVVMGHQNTTFANAGQVDEDTFEDHLEPRCVLICDALTIGYLQPNLIAGGLDPDLAAEILMWYDASAIIGKTDPKEGADYGIEKDVISGEAWRRVKGFSEDDAPSPEEMLIRAAIHLRSLDPTVSAAMLELLGVPLDIKPLPTSTGATPPATAAIGLGEMLTELVARRRAPQAITAAPSPRQAAANPGRQLMELDRELRARLIVAASRALDRALERAGNKLKMKRGPTKVLVRGTHPLYVAATLGPTLVAQAGFADDALIDTNAWDELERQFMTWGATAQKQAMNIAAKIGGFSVAERERLGAAQAENLGEAWAWMKEQLTTLAQLRLYAPDPLHPNMGEFDPTSRVPTGLVRQAVARAGGAASIEAVGGDLYVALSNGEPLGGIGTGELLMGALSDVGAGVEAYEWVYGPAYRQHPFEEHEALDGEIFAEFDSDKLSKAETASWLPTSGYFPGDHDGCACDVSPVIVEP